jgi:hypothetical protein
VAIQSYFRNLGSRGFQRLSNTTGGKPQDKQGRDPDEVALPSQFQYEYAEELLDVLIANYNAKKSACVRSALSADGAYHPPRDRIA